MKQGLTKKKRQSRLKKYWQTGLQPTRSEALTLQYPSIMVVYLLISGSSLGICAKTTVCWAMLFSLYVPEMPERDKEKSPIWWSRTRWFLRKCLCGAWGRGWVLKRGQQCMLAGPSSTFGNTASWAWPGCSKRLLGLVTCQAFGIPFAQPVFLCSGRNHRPRGETAELWAGSLRESGWCRDWTSVPGTWGQVGARFSLGGASFFISFSLSWFFISFFLASVFFLKTKTRPVFC